jgi:predicted O-methyltransferase YrrM
MTEQQWAAVDQYYADLLIGEDPTLEAALAASDTAGLSRHAAVSPAQGKMLHLLAMAIGAKRILEIGTLGGYSTIWLARALPADGKLITLEVSEEHAKVARANLVNAGVDSRVDVRVAPALDSLPILSDEGAGPFDLVFIDADKESNSAYFTWALRMSRPGTMIIVDNIVRAGQVLDPDDPDPRVRGARQFAELASDQRRVSATTIQTVGVKGWDGFTLAVVTED